MKVAIPKEIAQDERRVALVPDTAGKLIAAGLDVSVEEGAGKEAFVSDEAYKEAGVKVVKGAAVLLKDADVVLKVQPPSAAEVDLLQKGAVLISFLQPATQGDIVKALAKQGLKRMFLHARRLAFTHPVEEREVEIEAALPPELSRYLDALDSRRPPNA